MSKEDDPRGFIPSAAFRKAFPERWLSSMKGQDHEVSELLRLKRMGPSCLRRIDEKLIRLDDYGLLEKDVIGRLRSRFDDTMNEVEVILHLRSRAIEAIWGSEPPDIEIFGDDAAIEVKRLHSCDKLEESKGEVIIVDDMRRTELRLDHWMKSFEDRDRVNVLVVTGALGADEVRDLFVSVSSHLDPVTGEDLEHFDGLFSDDRHSIVSAVVGGQPGRYQGFANWKARRKVGEALRSAFSIELIDPSLHR